MAVVIKETARAHASAAIDVEIPMTVAKPSHHKIAKKTRDSIPGQAYLLTTTTLFSRPLFRDFEAANAVASVHNTQWVWRDSSLLAWVLMPDRWHALVVLGEQDELQKLMGRFKSASANSVANRFKTNGWLWAKGYHDHALRIDETLQDAGRHLVASPLRAGIVDDIGMYPYWDAVWLGTSDQGRPWS